MQRLPIDMPLFEPGWVWLAGAGPGDPGLLTLNVLNALQQADVVVYDALVPAAILALARPEARRDYAGKRGGRPSWRQADISLHLVASARSGARVLRLKGGDPFVFGRGAEEALALADAGIPFRILPGITAGIGGLAYAGIPATFRETNSVVSFVTGRSSAGALPDTIDWAALARSSPVIVVYMALVTLAEAARALIAAGRSPDEPVVIVSHATLPEQAVIETTLAECGAAALRAVSPAIAVIGDIVRLRTRLGWFDPGAGAAVLRGDGQG
jgi:uroporphyrin-III C-methyltransferase